MKKLIATLSLVAFFIPGRAQTDTVINSKSINVFLNCNYGCYQDYLRTQITWVNFVQDQFVSDVDLLVAKISTGSGGTDYSLFFNGKKRYAGMMDTLSFTTNAINTDAEAREMLAQKVKLGLVRYAAKYDLANDLLINSNNEKDVEDIGIGSNPDSDPYNAWVFRLSGNLNLEAQKVFQSGDFYGNIGASQVKESFKLEINFGMSYSEQRYNFDGISDSFVLRSQYASSNYIKSLGEHSAVGVFTTITLSDYSNYDYYQRTALSFEYNIFPYKEAQTKAITISATVGGAYYDFQDTTIYNQIEALVPYTGISMGVSLNQSWGSLSGALSANSFLNNFDRKRAGAWLSADVRIYKGLSVSIYSSFNIIHDQINIRKGGASEEEVLLEQQELQTNYRLYSFLGLSYRFGSIYNNVVNPRFDFGS
ncbi:MAG: hypothetical protein ACKVOR_13060 [Flavobacteriales bacterium]